MLEIDLAHAGTGHKISDPLLALVHFCELCTHPPHIAPEDRVALLRECFDQLPSDSLLETVMVDFFEMAEDEEITSLERFVSEISRIHACCHQHPPTFDLPPYFSKMPCCLVRFRVEQLPDTAPDAEVWEVCDGKFLLGSGDSERNLVTQITADGDFLTGSKLLWKIHRVLQNYDCGFYTDFCRLVFLGKTNSMPLFFLSCCPTFDPTSEPFVHFLDG